jgi:RNA polymerase sigma-70 factor (ECF subfamily)
MSLAERLLIARLRERDEQAFSEIVRMHGDKVFSLIYRMLGSRAEAEDVAQEVFITVFKTIDGFRGEAKFSTWLLRIAANQSKNRIKYLARRPTEGVEVDKMMEAAETEAIMQRAIGALDEEHRLLMILRDVEELSYQEIGEITGLPEGTIKSRLHRARFALKEELDKHTK